MEEKVLAALIESEAKAWEALSGYKFWMFGYHAARWINYNNLLPVKRPNPFRECVALARTKTEAMEENLPTALFA